MPLNHEETCNADGVPERFICPLTLEIMEHPLMTRAGHSFERSAILGWLRRNDKHPLTRESLSPRDLVQNGALKAEIALWKGKHCNVLDSETEASSSIDETDVCETLFLSALTVEDFEAQLQYGPSRGQERQATTTPTTSAAAVTATPTTATSSNRTPPSTADSTPSRSRRSRFSLGIRRRR